MTITIQLDASSLQYRIEIRPDVCTDGSIAYVAEIPELLGCMSHGATVEEARRNLEDAKREYLAALQERGLPVPAPSPDAVVSEVVWTLIRLAEVQEKVVPPKMPTATVEPLASSAVVTSA